MNLSNLFPLVAITLYIQLSACSSIRLDGSTYSVPATLPMTIASKNASSDTIKKWQYLYFIHNWNKHEEPAWSVDLLIAHLLVSPLLREYAADIELWRFHRRASTDKAGHRFAFIFYASDDTADRINREIQKAPLTTQLLDKKIIQTILYPTLSNNDLTHISATSDAHWPTEIQSAWPYYIMGVSEMWLSLIQEVDKNRSIPADNLSFNELLIHYEQLDTVIGRYWKHSGQHVFFHHINAIFEYRPLLIRESRPMRF